MKKIICICLLVIATLGAYLFVRNNQHIVMDVRYVLDTEIVDDNFFFVRAGSLYQYNDESGVKIISKEGICNITSTDDYLLYSNETTIYRMNLNTEEIMPIYISENEENQIEGVYCADKISVFRLDYSNYYITEIAMDGTVKSEEILNEEEYKKRRNTNEIYDDISVIGNVTVIDGYYMGGMFVSDSKSFIFKGKSGDDKEYKIFAYIPETGEVRKLSDKGLNGYSSAKIDTESGNFYIWDTKGREDINRYKVNYDENGYPVSLEYDRIIFKSDIK